MHQRAIKYLRCVGFLCTVVIFQPCTASIPTLLKALPSGTDVIQSGCSYVIPLKLCHQLCDHDRILYLHNVSSGSRLELGRVTKSDSTFRWTVNPSYDDLLRLVVVDLKTGKLIESSASYFRVSSKPESTETFHPMVDAGSLRLTAPEEEYDRIVKGNPPVTGQPLISAITYDGRVLDSQTVTDANSVEFLNFCRKWMSTHGIVYFAIQSENRVSLVRFN